MKSLGFIIVVAIAPASLHAQVVSNTLIQKLNGNHWENDIEVLNYTYNGDCENLYYLQETWDSSVNNWDNSIQHNFSYYGSGKLYQDSSQLWNTPRPGWNNDELVTYTYDGSNYLVNESYQLWDTVTNNWQNAYYQTNFINNTDGTPHIAYDLLLSGGVWDTSEIQTYIYNTPGQLDTELFVIHASGVFVNSSRFSYIYNTGYTTLLDQAWNTTSNSWQNEELETSIPYKNNPNSIITELWNNTASVWDTSYRTANTFVPCTPTAVTKINPADQIMVYPNPTTGYFTVTGLTQGQTVEIYNYIGQHIESRIADNTTIDFNIVTYASGMYLVRIQNKDGSMAAQKKIVKAQ